MNLKEARLKFGKIPAKVELTSGEKHLTSLAKPGETLSALQPDNVTFHSVTIKRSGRTGFTVHNHHTKEEEWYKPSDLYNAKGPLSK